MFALTLFFVFLALTVLGGIAIAIFRRIEKRPFVARSHMDHMVICPLLHYWIEKWWRHDPIYTGDKRYFRVRNCMWLVNTEDLKRWRFQTSNEGPVIYVNDRETTGYTRQVPVRPQLVTDIFVPTERPAIDPWTERIMFHSDPPFNADFWIYRETEKVSQIIRWLWAVTLIAGVISIIFGIAATGFTLDNSQNPANVTITVPGSDEVIIKDTTVGNSRDRLMVDGHFSDYVFYGKVSKDPQEIGGGFNVVCLGQKVSQACGLGVGKFEKGQIIYLREAAVAYKGDELGYSHESTNYVISEREAKALQKTGRLTFVKR
jgi:hypothetical protein